MCDHKKQIIENLTIGRCAKCGQIVQRYPVEEVVLDKVNKDLITRWRNEPFWQTGTVWGNRGRINIR